PVPYGAPNLTRVGPHRLEGPECPLLLQVFLDWILHARCPVIVRYRRSWYSCVPGTVDFAIPSALRAAGRSVTDCTAALPASRAPPAPTALAPVASTGANVPTLSAPASAFATAGAALSIARLAL